MRVRIGTAAATVLVVMLSGCASNPSLTAAGSETRPDRKLGAYEDMRARLREQLTEAVPGVEGEDRASFAEWFHQQRSFPSDHLPPGALARAFDAAMASNVDRSSAPSSPLPIWREFGPRSMPDGQTDTTAGLTLAPVSGRVQAIAVDPTNPNVVYVGAAQGGVWKSTNALSSNVRWRALTDNQPSLATGAITIDPVDTDIVYVGTGEAAGACDSYFGRGILRSTDGGETWTALGGNLGGPFFNMAVSNIIVDPSTAGSATATRIFASATLAFTTSGTSACGAATGTNNGSLWRSEDSGATWTRLNVPTGDVAPFRRIHDMALDPSNPDVLYVATRSAPVPLALGGIWKTVNARAATPIFAKLTAGLPDTATSVPGISRITLGIGGPAPAASQTVYAAMEAGTGSALFGFYKSINAGATWTHVDSGQNGAGNTAATVLTSTAGFAFTPSLVGRRIIFNGGIARVVTAVTNATTLTFSGAALALTGATWSIASYPMYCNGQCFYDMTIGVDPQTSDASVVYVGGSPQLYSDDLNTTCVPDPVFGGCPRGRSVYRSTDGGLTWRSVSPGDGTSGGVHTDDHAIVFDTSVTPSRVYDGNDGGVWVSSNRGLSWRALNTNLAITQFQSIATHPTNPEIALGGTQDNGTNIRGVGGVPVPDWFHTDFGDGGQAAIDQSTPTIMYHTYFNQTNNFYGPAKSVTGGDNSPGFWQFAAGVNSAGFENGFIMSDAVSFYAPLALHPAYTPNVVYFGSSRLYRSPNPQEQTAPNTPPASWTPVSPQITAGVFVSAIAPARGLIDISGPKELVYLGLANGTISVSTTGIDATSSCPNGVVPPPATCPTWTTISRAPLPLRFVTEIEVDARDATGNTVYVGFSGFNATPGTTPGHVFKSTNGRAGATTSWTDVSGNLPDVPVNAIALDPTTTPTTIYAGTDIGVFRSEDDGVTWEYLNNGHPNVAVFAIERNATTGQILSSTHGRGVFELIPRADALFMDGFE